jgi:hypothetical protein
LLTLGQKRSPTHHFIKKNKLEIHIRFKMLFSNGSIGGGFHPEYNGIANAFLKDNLADQAGVREWRGVCGGGQIVNMFVEWDQVMNFVEIFLFILFFHLQPSFLLFSALCQKPWSARTHICQFLVFINFEASSRAQRLSCSASLAFSSVYSSIFAPLSIFLFYFEHEPEAQLFLAAPASTQ